MKVYEVMVVRNEYEEEAMSIGLYLSKEKAEGRLEDLKEDGWDYYEDGEDWLEYIEDSDETDFFCWIKEREVIE